MQMLTLADIVEGLTGNRPRLPKQPRPHITKTVVDSRHAEHALAKALQVSVSWLLEETDVACMPRCTGRNTLPE